MANLAPIPPPLTQNATSASNAVKNSSATKLDGKPPTQKPITMAEKDINMEIKLTIPKQLEHIDMDAFKLSLKRLAFDIKAHVELKNALPPDVIPVSGLYEKEIAEALPQMFEDAEIDYSEEEIAELRRGVKQRLNQAYPWTKQLDFAYSHEYGEEYVLILLENPVAKRQCLVAENLTDHTYKVEKEIEKDHTLVPSTPEAMEKIRQYLECNNNQQKE